MVWVRVCVADDLARDTGTDPYAAGPNLSPEYSQQAPAFSDISISDLGMTKHQQTGIT